MLRTRNPIGYHQDGTSSRRGTEVLGGTRAWCGYISAGVARVSHVTDNQPPHSQCWELIEEFPPTNLHARRTNRCEIAQDQRFSKWCVCPLFEHIPAVGGISFHKRFHARFSCSEAACAAVFVPWIWDASSDTVSHTFILPSALFTTATATLQIKTSSTD